VGKSKQPAYGAIPLLFAMTLLGCQQPGAGSYNSVSQLPVPALSTNARNYVPGDAVTLRLTNTTHHALGYNLCRSSFERYVENDWSLIQTPIAEICTAELRTLMPGQAVTYSFPLALLSEGEYRVRTAVNGLQGTPGATVFSNSFRVTRQSTD
jgi:hypothetical protein